MLFRLDCAFFFQSLHCHYSPRPSLISPLVPFHMDTGVGLSECSDYFLFSFLFLSSVVSRNSVFAAFFCFFFRLGGYLGCECFMVVSWIVHLLSICILFLFAVLIALFHLQKMENSATERQKKKQKRIKEMKEMKFLSSFSFFFFLKRQYIIAHVLTQPEKEGENYTCNY